MTKPPRITAGEFSAEKTGTVTSFKPIPIPRSILTARISKWQLQLLLRLVLLPAGCELTPGLGEGHAEGGKQGEDGGNEDDTTTAKEVVEGIGNPPGTVRVQPTVALITKG